MRTSTLNVLLVEDNPGDVRLLREGLGEISGLDFELSHVDTITAAVERLGRTQFDVALIDLGLPDARGLEGVLRIREAAPDLPVLVLTAFNDESVAIQSLQEGVQDYLVKAEVNGASLWRAMRYALERHQRQIGLLSLSLVDDLTGLGNRKHFLTLATQHAKLARRTGQPFLIGFIDVDGLKRINDTCGHREGNHALVEAADVLRDTFRQSDILARYGGDEFAVLVSDASEGDRASVAARVQDKVRARNVQLGRRYRLSLSIGIVTSGTSPPADVGQLLDQADALMYEHKRGLKKRWPSGV